MFCDDDSFIGGICAVIMLVILLTFISSFFWYPNYKVWSKGLAGKAQLKEAEWNRQIAIQEASAKLESAKFLAQAEIEKAKGVAEANKIIGKSLQNNEAYLRYLWIHNLETSQSDVIYVPTEANLPILEAGKRGEKRRHSEIDQRIKRRSIKL